MGTPQAATTNAAAVEILKVPAASPPVPQVSIASSGALIRTGELERAKTLGCWAVAHLADQEEGVYARSRAEAEGWLAEQDVDCETRAVNP